MSAASEKMSLISNTSDEQPLKRRNSQEDLEIIKQWLQKQPHLPQNLDDVFLLNFLRGCKHSLEKFKKKLDMYFTIRSHLPEFFTNRDVSRPELQEVLRYCYVITLPTLTPEGREVYITGATTADFEPPDFTYFCKLTWMVLDLQIHSEQVANTGSVIIMNASVCTPKHFLKTSPVMLRKFFLSGIRAYPNVAKEVHVVNCLPLATNIFNIAKSFLNPKIVKRVHFHAEMESLHKHVPRDMLPEEYGGTAGKLDDYREKTIENLKRHTEWFKEQEKIVVDESKRIGKQYSSSDLLGIDGSFRQLTID